MKATWVGYPAEDVHGPLIPGQTVREITATEAKTSAHWQPVPAVKPGKAPAPTPADTEES